MASTGIKQYIKQYIENYAILFPLLPVLPFIYILVKIKQSLPETKRIAINITFIMMSFLIPGVLVETGVTDTMLYSIFNSPYTGRFITGYIFVTFFFAAVMTSDEK